MMYNSSSVQELSFDDIVKGVNVPPEEVSRALCGLCRGRFKFLTKEPDNNTIQSGDVLKFHAEFPKTYAKKNPPYRIRCAIMIVFYLCMAHQLTFLSLHLQHSSWTAGQSEPA